VDLWGEPKIDQALRITLSPLSHSELSIQANKKVPTKHPTSTHHFTNPRLFNSFSSSTFTTCSKLFKPSNPSGKPVVPCLSNHNRQHSIKQPAMKKKTNSAAPSAELQKQTIDKDEKENAGDTSKVGSHVTFPRPRTDFAKCYRRDALPRKSLLS
jgi:hypothetical protein